MGKSRYQIELEEFKAKIPEIIKQTAADHGMDLCEAGLSDLFQRLDVPYQKPVENCVVSLSFRIDLPVERSSWGSMDVAEDAEEDLGIIESIIDAALRKQFPDTYQKFSLDIQETFVA